jgi:Meiotically up-regulated gene 113
LEPKDRIRELSDASVPFNFDIHALFFAEDAVGIEAKMHERLANFRVNVVNRRREFFRVTPMEAKAHLNQLAGELLEFRELPEALEYRQCLRAQAASNPSAEVAEQQPVGRYKARAQ